jgi:quinoprotein glucose dehydrogenase
MASIMRRSVLACLLLSGNLVAVVAAAVDSVDQDWGHYGGDAGGSQYSPLTQINKDNIHGLIKAWTARTGDLGEGFANKGHSFQATPVSWDGKLFLNTSANLAFAFDAATGAELWRFDAQLDLEADYSENGARGVSLWHDSKVKTNADCAHRIFYGTLDGRLISLDANSGLPCRQFGKQGQIDLSADVSLTGKPVERGDYGVTSPPVIAHDRVVVGSAVGDNRAVSTERGVVRAFDARSGKLLWQFDPIPREPSNPAYTSWQTGRAEITGAANAWAPLSVDVARRLVFVPTSSPSPDFYGGERLGNNNYANSLVALNLDTGKVVWHQQLVHHDVWDYDVPAQPTLTHLLRAGQKVPAVVVVTKTGMLFAFHRETGDALFAVEERAVPRSDVTGEQLAPTQPFSSVASLASQRKLGPEDAFGIAWFDKRGCQKILREFRSEGIFTPPSLKGSVLNPGWAGGSNWGGVAIDEQRQIAVANVMQIPGLIKLIPRSEMNDTRRNGEFSDWQVSSMMGTPYVMARRLFLSGLGLPCTKPPWGKLVAVDLAEGTILWERPLGSIEDLAPAPVPNFEWGVPNLGGALITEGGVVIIGAASDYYLRGFDLQTGTELWRARLPTAAMATPMTYSVGGKQYVAVAVGGSTAMGLKRGDYLMAFKLPESD